MAVREALRGLEDDAGDPAPVTTMDTVAEACKGTAVADTCVLTRAGGGDPVPLDRLTEDRFRVKPPALAASTEAAAGPSTGKPVMLSYKHREREGELALEIREGLEAGGTHVWIDIEGITGGSTWRQKISEGIQSAQVVVFALSGRSVVSPFCEEEICLAARLGKPILPARLGKPILPALVSAAPSRADYRPQMLQLRDTQWVDFHGQAFDVAMAELQSRVSAMLAGGGKAAAKQGSRARAAVPECPDDAAKDQERRGRVFVAHAGNEEDTDAAETIRDWIMARSGAESCSVLGAGEHVDSPLRKADLAGSDGVVAVMMQAYISDGPCWKELSDWDEAHGTAGTASLVPVYVEDLGAGWTGAEHTAALELVVSRHNGLSTDLSKARRPEKAMAALCSKVGRLIGEQGGKGAAVGDGGSGGPHVATGGATASGGTEAAERIELAEERARLAEERAKFAEERGLAEKQARRGAGQVC